MRGLLRHVVLLSCLAAPVLAQAAPASAPDRDAALAVVKRMFDGMRARDSVMIMSTMAPGARLISTFTRDGTPGVDTMSSGEFAHAAATSKGPTWDERFHDPEVRQDGNLISVWTPYEFYLGEKFSHCGIDAFYLVRLPDGWRITALAWSSRREGCGTAK